MESEAPNTVDREPRGWGGGMPMSIDSVDCRSLLVVGGRIGDSVAVLWLPGLVVLGACWVSARHLTDPLWFCHRPCHASP